MKKIIVIGVICMMISNINAIEYTPRYRIYANSNNKNDIQYMYDLKNNLIKDYSLWVKGVDNKKQVLIDHLDNYDAELNDNEYVVYIGEGKGRYLSGELKTNYCSSSKDIKKRSLIWELLFGK